MIEMNPQRNKFVRFKENDEFSTNTTRPSVTSVMRTFKQPLSFRSRKNKENKKKILRVMNPNDSYLQNWNKIFLLLSVVALAFDPLFFYIPVVNPERFCLNLDQKLEAIACVFRTFIDAFYVVHMLFQFHTGFIAPSSRGFGRGELNENPKEIAIRYLGSYFIIDLLSILPIPQVEQSKKLHIYIQMNHQKSKFARIDTRNLGRSVDGNFKSVRGRLKKVCRKMKTLENWRKTVLLACVVALAIDPLFLFIPVIDSRRFCFTFDKKLGAAVCVLRTFIDTFYVIHIIFHLITELIAPRSQVSLRGELIVHSKAILKTRLLFHFIVDIFSVLPLPQVMVLTLSQRSASLVSKKILKWIILCQYLPRIIRIYPIFKEVTRVSGTVAESKWIGAALNFFLYILHSYVFGAFWYVSAIEKKSKCWHDACARTSGCNLTDLFCARGGGNNRRFLNTSCPLIDPAQITNSTHVFFNFGMFIDALKSGVVEVEPRDFPRKFVYCFWWGLRNISALGQNLETSDSAGEIFFAIIICVSGLLLFAVLIGNVQKYLQSTTIRVEEMKEKKRDTEKWMSYRMLPEYLKERIRRYEDYKWRETRGTEEEALLRSLPKDLRLETKRHLYKNMLKRVPWLNYMDDSWLLEALCDRVKSVFYSANSYIVREGDPVEEMLIVTRGNLNCITESSEKAGYYDSSLLKEGDICGDLLFWILNPRNSPHLPTSNRTVMTLTDVEGFILLPDDLKFVASHFNRFHNKTLHHMFRYYSVHWQLWAARFIQAAWKRYCKRKNCKILRVERDYKKNPQGTHINLGATLYVSTFVSKASWNRRENAADCSSSSHMSPPLPHKPADPQFSKDEE